MIRIHLYLLLLGCLWTTSCSEESYIEGMVFSDKIKYTDINKTFDLVVTVPSYEGTMTINDVGYAYSFMYNETYGNSNAYSLLFSVSGIMGFIRTQGGAVYPVPEGEEFGPEDVFNAGYAPLFSTINGTTNLSANSIEPDKPFYIGFCAGLNNPDPAYGWLKVEIRSEKKLIIHGYAYRIGKPIKAGEK